MALPFSRTLRAVEADGRRGRAAGLVTVVLLGAWGAWFLGAEVPVQAVSRHARIEAAGAGHAVEAPVGGEIVSVSMTLGQTVRAGETLVVLDDRGSRRALDARREVLAGLTAQLEARRGELASEETAQTAFVAAGRAGLEADRARTDEAAAAAAQAEDRLTRTTRMRAEGHVPEAEATSVRLSSEGANAALEARRRALGERATRDRGDSAARKAHIEAARARVSALSASVAATTAEVAALADDVSRYTLKAPIDGRISWVGELRSGGYLALGQRVAVVVPEGELKLVATFDAGAVIGRAHPGQSARLALDGFPWTEFGHVSARVTRIGEDGARGETGDGGGVRVEFSLESPPRADLPLHHGQPGRVEIELERASPARLLLRALGARLSGGPAGGPP